MAIKIWNQRGETVMTVKRSFMVYTKATYEALDLKVPGGTRAGRAASGFPRAKEHRG